MSKNFNDGGDGAGWMVRETGFLGWFENTSTTVVRSSIPKQLARTVILER